MLPRAAVSRAPRLPRAKRIPRPTQRRHATCLLYSHAASHASRLRSPPHPHAVHPIGSYNGVMMSIDVPANTGSSGAAPGISVTSGMDSVYLYVKQGPTMPSGPNDSFDCTDIAPVGSTSKSVSCTLVAGTTNYGESLPALVGGAVLTWVRCRRSAPPPVSNPVNQTSDSPR